MYPTDTTRSRTCSSDQ